MRRVALAEMLAAFETREEVERVIESLVDALDELDGDADSEPSLGSVGGTAEDMRLDQTGWAFGQSNDAEFDVIEAERAVRQPGFRSRPRSDGVRRRQPRHGRAMPPKQRR